ncbi:MAG: hypothetical protein Q9227_003894 [Pyrenula ochraceoflavens]
MTSPVYHALIRTHHITSRKKVSTLKAAAEKYNVHALLRSGGVPGVMYVEGSEEDVAAWVGSVHDLRYKDYQLVARPELREVEEAEEDMRQPKNKGKEKTKQITKTEEAAADNPARGLEEIDTVKEFAAVMGQKGVHGWFRKAMGYTS